MAGSSGTDLDHQCLDIYQSLVFELPGTASNHLPSNVQLHQGMFLDIPHMHLRAIMLWSSVTCATDRIDNDLTLCVIKNLGLFADLTSF